MTKVSLPFVRNPSTSEAEGYQARKGRPFLFNIGRINDPMTPLYPVWLALHTNPETMDEKFSKSNTVSRSYAGYIEFQWPDELSSISCSGSSGLFINPDVGLASSYNFFDNFGLNEGKSRSATMAYERLSDFLELFRSNGNVYTASGRPAVRSSVLMMYDRGIYAGLFDTFEVSEVNEKQFSFDLSWSFKVENSIYRLTI